MQRRIFHTDPAELTAVLSIDGLAVCHFNKADTAHKLWEVAFLREQTHDLKILITQQTPLGEQIDDKGQSYDVPKEVRRLELVVENGSESHYAQFPDGHFSTQAEFGRSVGDDRNDFRWVIDFVGGEVPHGKFSRLIPPSAFDVVLLKIPSSLLYTERVTRSPMLLLRAGMKNKDESFVFGHTNEVVGAHVLTERPGSAVLIGTDLNGNPIEPFPIPLPHQEGFIYHIAFENMERKRFQQISEMKAGNIHGKGKPQLKEYAEGDFDLFYKVIEVTQPERYNLYGPKPTSEKGKLGDCNLVSVSGTGTLERLLD